MSAIEMHIAITAKEGPNGTRNPSFSGFSFRNRINDAQTRQFKIKDEAAAIAATHKNVPPSPVSANESGYSVCCYTVDKVRGVHTPKCNCSFSSALTFVSVSRLRLPASSRHGGSQPAASPTTSS
jgi:hypothetical protein